MSCEVTELIGKTLSSIINNNNQELIFVCTDGTKYKMFHDQDCYEYVSIDDICGDLYDLVGQPILLADESTNDDPPPEDIDTNDQSLRSFTWTFYRVGTIEGGVTIRWYGESNGYYSERVDFQKI